jgi:hypothetical protein
MLEAATPASVDASMGWSERMLDAYVIEEIKRRQQRPERDERPVAEVPVPPPPEPRPGEGEPERPGRGVVVIDLD